MALVPMAVFALIAGGAWCQQITKPPLNTAAKNGQNARMNCTVELAGGTVEWRSYVNEVGGERIFVSSRPDDILLPGYDVEYDNDEHFDLIFNNVGSDHAGSYSCKLLNDDITSYAQMVTVSDLTCSNSAGATEVVEGQTVLMECEVSYHGYRAPVLAWSGMYSEFIEDEENPQRIKYNCTANKIFALSFYGHQFRFITNVTAEPSHDGMDFHCDLHFEAKEGDEKEPPIYTDNCHTNFVIVYAPTNIQIYPDPDSFDDQIVRLAVGEEIIFTADGNPAPTYTWFNSDMSHVVAGDTLTMTEELVNGGTILYRCEATNTINGVPRYATKNVTLMVSMPEAETTTSMGDQTDSSPLDPCNRDWFCDIGDILPDPYSCLHYFYCVDGQWGRIKCPRGYLFDWSSDYCRDEDVICHPNCLPKPTPVEPGLCETVTSCVVGEKFADRASCIHFWECIESEGILERKMCGAQRPTYVFDIDQRECLQPDASFDCEMRCPF
ncbi:hypothetical protein CAPTEDRAFT_212178 [Capitella teleta]|uniref:Chitinase n=1 Tax=Capitella teleta TaxID=283909 RepID=R7UY54_CAPTE|nr:hypothetical protein CAPTEDRAFT_212178 [Capitella teleta]|eukprot:ELU11513.1 hypothetical protein CAPTEDRAFT_212178 [Capitella teleta]